MGTIMSVCERLRADKVDIARVRALCAYINNMRPLRGCVRIGLVMLYIVCIT